MYQQVIISCGSKKLPLKKGEFAPAFKLYQGSYFNQMLNLAVRLSPNVYILSAAYGLLELGDMVETYDLKMNKPIANWMKMNGLVRFNGASLLGTVYSQAVIGNLEQIIPTMGMGLKASFAKEKSAGLPVLCNLNTVRINQEPKRFITPEKYW